MIIVADTSALVALAACDELSLLDQLFQEVRSSFVSGATAVLKYLTYGGTYNKSTSYANSGQVSLSASFTNTTATWSVQVVNPNGSASNVFNFQVQKQ